MSGLKQLRNRVKSIKSTQKITKAMQVVSAAKLKKVKDRAIGKNNYISILSDVMSDIAIAENFVDLSLKESRFFSKDIDNKPHLMVVMTSERGLCAGFNSNIVKRVKRDIEQIQSGGQEVKLLVIGKKGRDALNGKYSKIVERYYNNSKGNIELLSSEVKSKLISMIEGQEVGTCHVYYNKFKNAMTQIVTRDQILPVNNEEKDHSVIPRDQVKENNHDLISEYEGENLIEDVINLYLGGVIQYGLLQNKASEEGARMTAMDNATRNAGELIDKLTLKLNRSRQAIITTELTEIISGSEAV